MATWTTITDSQVDPDAPLTSGLAYAWRDNPVAIAEGASGAPKIARNIYGGSATGSGSVTFTGIDAFSGVDMLINFTGSSAGSVTFSLVLEFSNDGSTWLAGATIFSQTGTTVSVAAMRVWVNFSTATYFKVQNQTYSTAAATNASTDAVSMRIRSSGSGSSVSFAVSAEFNGGIL